MPEPDDESSLPLVLEQARRLLAREVRPAIIDREATIPSSVLDAARQGGLFAMSIPEADGGLGLDLGECAQVIAELARVDRSVATTIGLHNGLGVLPLIELGSDALRRQYLPRLAEGELIAAFAATEAGAGSDLQSIRTTATPTDRGTLVLEGEKHYVTNGGFAGLYTVLARTPELGGKRSQALVCVPRDLPGVEVGPEDHKLGIRGSSTITLRLDGVEVPRENLLGAPGLGAEHAHRALEWGRSLMSAGCLGTAETALALTAEHALTRRQFGRPIVRFEASRHHLATMASTVFTMGAVVELVGATERAGEDIALVSTVAKVLCSEGAFDTCDRAIQLHGALGFIEEPGVALLARDCRVTRIFEGANDVLLVRLGVGLLSGAVPVSEAPKELPASLADLGARLVVAQGTFEVALAEARRAHGLAAVRRQLLLQRFARAKIALIAAAAVIDKATRDGGDAVLRAEHAVGRALVDAAHHLEGVASTTAEAAADEALVRALFPDNDVRVQRVTRRAV